MNALNLRRQAYDLTCGYAVAGLGFFAVQPHLPCAQQLFEQSMTKCGIVPLEPAVDTQAGVIRPHQLLAHTSGVRPAHKLTHDWLTGYLPSLGDGVPL